MSDIDTIRKHNRAGAYGKHVGILLDEIDRLTERNKNLVESLRGISQMQVSEGDRMRQWAVDSLSGFAPLESTIKKMQDQINSLTQAKEVAEQKLAQLYT